MNYTNWWPGWSDVASWAVKSRVHATEDQAYAPKSSALKAAVLWKVLQLHITDKKKSTGFGGTHAMSIPKMTQFRLELPPSGKMLKRTSG
jgi:hypothetical protein